MLLVPGWTELTGAGEWSHTAAGTSEANTGLSDSGLIFLASAL